MVLTVVSQYTYDLARLNKRSKDNVLVRGIVEEIAVEIRRAYDMYQTNPRCTFAAGQPYGAQDGARLLCRISPNQICVQIPNSTRQFCASYDLITVAELREPNGESIVLNFRWRDSNPWPEAVAYWTAEKLISISAQLQILPQAFAQQARSDRYRRPPPDPLLVDNILNPLAATETIRCATGPVGPPGEQVADCYTIQVCDSTLDCSDPKNVVTQRLAFLRN